MGEKQKGTAMNDIPIVYKCDFERNKECKKTVCQELCFHTLNPEYSIDGKRYKFNVNTGKLENLDT